MPGGPPADRVALLAGATAVVVASQGDVVLLAMALVVGLRRPSATVAAAGALAATAVRWGTTSLDGIAGAQSVLGPGAVTGPTLAIASAWSAAAALLLAAPGPVAALFARWGGAIAVPFGLTAGLVLAGPGTGGPLALRAGAGLVAVAIGVRVVAARQATPDLDRRAGRAGALLGVAAVVLAGLGR
ncbi:MAG: hypothetical protein ACT4PW_04270 [Acidimicrobiia bacterium]